MFTTILVPLDGSSLAERAVPYAEKLARATGATLTLVRAETSGITGSRVIVLRQAMAYLEQVAAGLRAGGLTVRAGGLTVRTSAPYGPPAASVVAEARRIEADLIVLATHGRSGMSHVAYGSVAEEIIARAPAPVLLVGARDDDATAPLTSGAPVLVPLDGTAFAERGLPAARELAGLLHGGVVLVQALGEAERMSEDEVATLDYLREIARLELPGVEVTCVARMGKTAEVIAEVCGDYGAALVVMATHRRFGLARYFFGNTANDAIHDAGVPFLLLAPPPVEEDLSEAGALVGLVLG
jgi:nucleotide-binding universal stress UspA family protein